MIRKNGTLQPVSREEAIDAVARFVQKHAAEFGVYGSGQWTITEGYTAMKFLKGGCSSNHLDPNAPLCMASAVVGMLTTYGVDEPAGSYDDFGACDTVVLWGNNPAKMHPVLWSRIVDRRSKGDKIEIFDLATRRVPQLNAAMPKAYVELHPLDARKLNLSTGDKVRISSRRGSIELPAWINGRSMPQKGLVFVPFFEETALINQVTLHEFCPLSKEPDYKKCAVKPEKV